MRTGNMKYVEKFLSAVFTKRDEFAIQYLSKAFKYFDMDFTPVPLIKDSEAKEIKTPITIFAAKDDILFPGIKMNKRANKIFPSIKKTFLLNHSKHVQSTYGNSIVEKTILDL